MAEPRSASIELYRILLMFGIVALHTLCCAGLGFSPLARWLGFCVDGFVFISGWYGIRFGWLKILKLYGLALWCSLVYVFAEWLCFGEAHGSIGAFVSSVVHRAEGYWFVNAYVVLMCLAPIVNAAVESQKARKAFAPILAVVFIWSFACEVPGLKSWVPHAVGFYSHSFLTLLGVYVVARIARLDHWDARVSTQQLLLVLVVLSLLAFCNLNKYNSPVAVLMGGVLFVLFSRINLRHDSVLGRAVLFLSPSMFAVYLLHACGADFVFIKSLLSYFSKPWTGCLNVVLGIFVACLVIDTLRRYIIRVFADLVRKFA